MSYGLIQETYTETITNVESVIFNQNVTNAEFIMIEVDTLSSPLTSFTIQMKGHAASSMSDMFSSSEDYLNPTGLLRGASCDMTTLNGTGGWVMLDTRGISQVSLKVSSSVSGSITVRVGG